MTTPAPQPRPAADLRTLQQFIALDMAAAAAGVLVSTTVLVAFSAQWLLPVLLACAASVLLLATGYAAAGAGRIDLAVYLVVSTFWLMLVITTTVVPSIFGGFAVMMVWPVLLAVPHVTRTTLRSISVVTACIAALTIPLALRRNPSQVTSGVPEWVFDAVFVVGGMVFVGLSIKQVWAYSGRLTRALNELRSLNLALVQSERVLEARVAVRTQELVDTTRELAAVLDNIADGLITIDRDGLVTRVNPAAMRMFDCGPSQWEGCSSAIVVPWVAELGSEVDVDGSIYAAGDVALAGGRVGHAVSTPITDADGDERGTVVMISDVTTARQVDRMKTDFISTVSHELRTPLTSVLGFVKLIRRRFDDRVVPAVAPDDTAAHKAVGQIRHDVAVIVSEGERLARLIDDLLDISRIEAGAVAWRDEVFDVNDVVLQAVAATRTLFDATPLSLELDLGQPLAPVRGDSHRIVQVVVNLLSNARKFTERGTVRVMTRALDDAVSVSVSDSGSGIHEDDFPSLFERFRQVGDTLTGKPHGTGLGLPICKEIVEHHGGRFVVESRVGRGSTFTFTLPVQAPAPDQAPR